MSANDEMRQRVARAAVVYGLPENRAATFAAVVARKYGNTYEAALATGKPLAFDTWFEDILKRENEMVSMMKTLHSPTASADKMTSATYEELVEVAKADPAAFTKWRAEHAAEFEAKRHEALKPKG